MNQLDRIKPDVAVLDIEMPSSTASRRCPQLLAKKIIIRCARTRVAGTIDDDRAPSRLARTPDRSGDALGPPASGSNRGLRALDAILAVDGASAPASRSIAPDCPARSISNTLEADQHGDGRMTDPDG